jgi:hypothetical protein
MQVIEKAGPSWTRVRAWEVDEDRYVLTPAEWLARCRADREGTRQVIERVNKVTDHGMRTLAKIIAGQQGAHEDGRWWRQVIGTGAVTGNVATADKLDFERFRKPFTEFLYDDKTVTSNTFFTGADFSSAQSTVAAAPAPNATVFTVADITPGTEEFKPGDLIRVGLATGYEKRRILSIAGSAITLATPLSAAPVTGNTVDQVIDEAGLAGNVAAGYVTGTVAVTNGNPTVTGSGTLWVGKVAAGDFIKVGAPGSNNRNYYEILTVNSNTSLTLTANYPGATASGQAYNFRGTQFNRVQNLGFIKLPTRGFVFENSWLMGGT